MVLRHTTPSVVNCDRSHPPSADSALRPHPTVDRAAAVAWLTQGIAERQVIYPHAPVARIHSTPPTKYFYSRKEAECSTRARTHPDAAADLYRRRRGDRRPHAPPTAIEAVCNVRISCRREFRKRTTTPPASRFPH